MGLDYQNWWKFFIDAWSKKILEEFGSNQSIYLRNSSEVNRGTQYWVIEPVSSELLEYNADLETRNYNFLLTYVNEAGLNDSKRYEYVMNLISRMEALIANNITIRLEADDRHKTSMYNCATGTTVFDTGEPDEPYQIQMELSCTHTHIIAET